MCAELRTAPLFEIKRDSVQNFKVMRGILLFLVDAEGGHVRSIRSIRVLHR